MSERLKVLTSAGPLRPTRLRQWPFYCRDERRIAEVKRLFMDRSLALNTEDYICVADPRVHPIT